MPYELLEDDQSNSMADFGQEALRHGSRTLSNIGTQAVGLPGDIFSLINEYIAKPVTKGITGEEGVPYEETFLGKALPTTETHRKGLEPVFGEYLKPKNKVEAFADDVIEDTALLLNPTKLVSKTVKAVPHAFKSFAKSLGANVIGEGIGQAAGNENAGTFTKAGALLALSIMDQPAAVKQIGELYRKAEKHLPESAAVDARALETKLASLEKSISKDRPLENLSPSEKFVTNQISKIRNLTAYGELNIAQAWAQKRSLNQELSTLYKEVPKIGDQKKVKGLAKQLNSYLNEAIKEYGKENPEFYKPFKEADEAFGTLARSNFVGNWIDSNIVHSPVTIGLMHLFTPVTMAGSAFPVYYGAKLTYRIAKSPTLRKIYGNTLKAAAKEDAKSFNKYFKELDDALQEEESEDKYEFID